MAGEEEEELRVRTFQRRVVLGSPGSPDSKKNYSREKGGGAKTKYETAATVRTLPHGGGSCNCSPGGGQRNCRSVGRAVFKVSLHVFRLKEVTAPRAGSALLAALRSATSSSDSPQELLLEQVTRKHL